MSQDGAPQVSALTALTQFDSFMEAFFYGNIIATALFGITIVQGWNYANKNTDKWSLRLLVAVLVLLDFATTCLDSQALHHYLVSDFGDPTTIGTIAQYGLVYVILCY
ncbi:hypothetical protein VKT23_018563 [Stygiomarasmius scandens]|uniref:Uncharacterized protein n=1 Tax=Marasmiellus scandens TaxID=2682957 RepID=A0ABR1INX0_9AGAR